MKLQNDSKTFLGFIDEPIIVPKFEPKRDLRSSNNSSIDDDYDDIEDIYPYSTKIGGAPIWCAQPPNHLKDIRCKTCNSYLSFLIQAYCPLNSLPNYERNFYIFVCPNANCNSTSKGWKVIKCLDPLKEDDDLVEHLENNNNNNNNNNNEVIKKQEENDNDDWGVNDGDDWGIKSNGNQQQPIGNDDSKSIEELLQIRDLGLKQKENGNGSSIRTSNYADDCTSDEEIISGIQLNDDKCNQIEPYFLCIEEESNYTRNSNNNNSNNIMKKYSNLENEFGDDPVEWSNESYEYVKDRTFNKFLKKISVAPSQCLRYSYNGKPLCLSIEGLKQITTPPICTKCNQTKVFEFQILSTIISQIKAYDHIIKQYTAQLDQVQKQQQQQQNDETNSNNNNSPTVSTNSNHLEFGNAFIFSCPNNCFEKSDIFNDVIYTEESIIVEKSV
ncbi:hypothetical protein DLAC_04282 [Tieghemostelium lacteum]|uniref:Programmed cell death protein 2 C-terminal domain-containing protein n=1 Tax=Tieghemostelium lacteum TaxID=361077 RepID=A0A151ZSP9_TIELA|nr:hypothetical protein DLAC_04282 [Tieghemostelium lacteum]|eukprot:KYQ96960.1 hypothetical protein DLAC_04282 [Tieghemostelium lacteum]